MNGTAPQQRTGTQAVQRALGLLSALEAGPDTMTLTELARATGLSASTTHRIARALCDASILFQDEASERYGLGSRLVTLGARAAATTGLAAAQITLERLAAETGESVNLGAWDDGEVVVLLWISSTHRLRFDQEVGTRVPAHASAMGKAILSTHGDLDATIRALPTFAKLTNRTITSRAAFKAELVRTRNQGWALNDEEREAGVRSIAVAVASERPPAGVAIAVQGPTVRMTTAHLKAIAPPLLTAAEAVAVHLGSAF